MHDMIDDIAAFEGRIAKIEGPLRSGKTEALIRRCARLIANGAAPGSILVGVSTAFAAQAFRHRLRRALPEQQADAADLVCIRTALEACVDVLDQPAAREATGRVPRILTNAEYNFLLEDMKTTGEHPRQLRRMLFHFYRSMTSGAPRDTWAPAGSKEEIVLSHLIRTLKLRGGMLAQEAPVCCATYLKSDAGASARGAFAYVLCDDFQNLSHAEQTCLCLMANKQVIVAGNPNQEESVASRHPYAEGFTRFDAVRRGVNVFHLETSWGNRDVLAFADAISDNAAMDATYRASESHPAGAEEPARARGVMSIKWGTPDDEVDGLTKYLRALLADVDDLREAHTCVVVPNRHWAVLTEKLLRRRGFSVTSVGATSGIGGDPRNTARCRALLAYTRLNLLAHPDDLVAWRSWCGFDHALTNSDAWAGLESYADEEGVTLLDALEGLGHAGFGAKEPFLRSRALAERWRSGQEFIAKNAARRGFGLLKAIGAEGLTEFDAASSTMLGDETAQQLYQLVRASILAPAWPEDQHAVHLATFDALCGTEYDNLVIVGAIDGFMPNRNAFEVISTEEDRTRIMNSERRAFASGVAKAKQLLIISHFSKADLELAERTKMQVVRVKSEGGQRVAIVRPSSFLQEAGNAAPTTTGGQALLAQHDLI